MQYTKAEAISLTNSSSIKNKNGRKWENLVEKTLQENNFLPDGNLVGSIFKTKTYQMFNNGEFFKKKIIDQWLPKFNNIIECKNSIGDPQIAEFMIATDSLRQSNEFGNDYKFTALINEKPDSRFEKKLTELQSRNKNFNFYVGERGLKEYIKTLSTPVTQQFLPIGRMEMTKISEIFDNDINRELDMVHVHKLVDSLITPMRNGSIRGLVRPFIGINSNGKKQLVDAHHLKKAVGIVNEFTPYTVDEVPVYYLEHLEDCTEEELTMLMSVINTLVKLWDSYDYVKLWEKTYGKLNEIENQYPYTKLRESMELLNPDNPNSAPILQAFCLEDRSEESNWGSNTKKIHYGELKFDDKRFEKKFEPIVQSILQLRERIEKTRKVVGSSYRDNKLGETVKTPTALQSVMRAFATESSLQEFEYSNKEAYYESLKDLANGYWNSDQDIIPIWNSLGDYEISDYSMLTKFPKSGNDMKEVTKTKIIPSLVRKHKRLLNNK